jgi:hypothetical protein
VSARRSRLVGESSSEAGPDEDALRDLPGGLSWLGVRVAKTLAPVGRLWVWSRGEGADDPGLPGQWFLDLDRAKLEPTGLTPVGWAHLLSRLGVHPVGLAPRFAAALSSPQPLAVVVDTSALYGGVMTQVVQMRAGRPLHLAAPDTTFMEVQTHLEREAKGAEPGVKQNVLRHAPHRLFRRVRRAGVVPHFLRPPEALVRYFGHEKEDGANKNGGGANIVQGEAPAPNHHRDRLIIEAARELKRSLPDVPVWIATCDQNLAIQADMEGFHAGLAWVTALPDKPRYTSPWIEPHALTLHHVDVSTLLADIIWTFGNVVLKPEDAKNALEWHLPSERRDVALDLFARRRVLEPRANDHGGWPSPEGPGWRVPQKAPAPQKVIEALLGAASGSAPEFRSSEAQYLVAVGWVSVVGDAIELTEDGKDAARAWNVLRSEDAEGWCAWMVQASAALRRLPSIKALLAVLTTPGMNDADLGKAMGIAERTAESQAVLSATLGVTVRLGGKNWPAAPDDGNDEDTVLRLARELRRADPSGSAAVRTDRLFTALLPSAALPLHRFRRALLALAGRRALEPGGSAQMTEPESPVKLRTLVPAEPPRGITLFTVDLGAGTFLLPGESSQVFTVHGSKPS